MHAYCLISAVGSRGVRAAARAPQEMDQPPAFKTRRSNAVHSRRLALHVSLLERHMVALATERARTVRQLHEELRQLRVSRLPPRLSPSHRQIVGNISQKFVAPNVKILPKLICANEKSEFAEDQNKFSNPAHQRSHEKSDGCIPDDAPGMVAGNFPDYISKHDQFPLTGQLDTVNHVHKTLCQNEDGTHSCPKSSTVTTDSAVQVFQRGKQGGSVCLLRTSKDKEPPYSVSTKQTSKPVPSSNYSFDNHCQCQSQNERQYLSGKDTEEQTSETRQVLKMQDAQQVGLHKNELSDHFTETPKSLGPRADEIVRSTQESAPPVCRELEPDQRKDKKRGRRRPAVTLSAPVTIPPRSPSYRRSGSSPQTMGDEQHSPLSMSLPCPLVGETPPPHSTYRCKLFPCAQPHTYHSLGFHPDPSSHPWRGWIAQNTCRPHHRLAPGRLLPPVGMDGRRTPADAPGYTKRKKMGKEEVMMLDMARKKQLHAQLRPPSWNTNYGQPTPYKRLKNPVMPMPID